MKVAESSGSCVYWGYSQSESVWQRIMEALSHSPENQHSRLCIEAHMRQGGPDMATRHREISDLKRGSGLTNVFQTTRVRDPLDFYLSYCARRIPEVFC